MVENKIYEDEIDLREYLAVLFKRWPLIVGCAFVFALLALFFSLRQSPVYEAKATLLIRSGGNSNSLSQFAGLAGLAGINLSSGGGGAADLGQIIQSRAVASRVLEELKLREKIKGWDDPDLKEDALAGAVQGMLKKPKSEGGMMELTVEFSDPALAAEIANGYADALSYYWNKLNYTEARKKKEYIESQLPRVEKDLKNAEQRLKQFTLLSSGLGGKSLGLQSQGIEVARLARELEIQNTVYTMLRKEFETVKLEESKEIPPFSMIDKALKPTSKTKPKTKFNMMVGMVVGLFSGVFIAFFKEYWEGAGKSKL